LGAPGHALTRGAGAAWYGASAQTEVAVAQTEVVGAALGKFDPIAIKVSAASSSAASAQERVPSRRPLIIGSSSLKATMVLNRASSPLEPSPKLSDG
jgi:hypothetical protein